MQAIVGLLVAISLSQAAPAAPAGRLAGRVTVEGADTPIAGARIILMPAGRPAGPTGPPPQAMSDQDGRFAFDRLAPGEYRLDAQKSGFAPLVVPGTRPGTIVLAAGQSLDGVSIRLQKGGVIAGKVLDQRGDPFTELQVMAIRRVTTPAGNSFMPAPTQGSQQTNDLGEFRVAGLPPGEYYIAAMPRRISPFGGSGAATGTGMAIATTFYPGTTDQTSAQSLVVASGGEVGNIIFTMQSAPAFSVSGRVVDEEGKPVARAMVMLMGDSRNGIFMGPAGNAQTQDDGRFAMGEVRAGAYRITASVPIVVENGGSTGGIAGGTVTTFSSGQIGGPQRATEIVVADADVRGVQVVVRRPPQ